MESEVSEGGRHASGLRVIEVIAQAVPAHIGSPTPVNGYDRDPYAAFPLPAVETDPDGHAPHFRAVVFITEYTIKGPTGAGRSTSVLCSCCPAGVRDDSIPTFMTESATPCGGTVRRLWRRFFCPKGHRIVRSRRRKGE